MVATNIDVLMKCRRLEMFFRTTNKEKYYQGNNVDNHTRFLLDQKKKERKIKTLTLSLPLISGFELLFYSLKLHLL